MGERVINKWSPDTCGCVINYSWDRDSPENTRIHTYEGHDKKCQDHGDLMEHHLYNTVVEENQRKNITLDHAIRNHKTKLAEGIKKSDREQTRWKVTERNTISMNGIEEPLDDNVTLVLKKGENVGFFFTGQAPDRILNLTFTTPLDEMEKRVIEDRFPGRVKVH